MNDVIGHSALDIDRPMRRRGVDRLHLLLDATEALLADHPNANISLGQIAERAGVPLSSVYHFLPNRNEAFVLLAKRFNAEFYEMATSAISPAPESWQDLVAFKARNSAAFINSRPAALRLFLGAGVSVEVRSTHFVGDATVAQSRVKLLEAYFHLPPVPDLATKIAMSIALQDGIWALSYGRFGSIVPEFLSGSIEAAVAYLRCHLPAYLQPKTPTVEELRAIDILSRHDA